MTKVIAMLISSVLGAGMAGVLPLEPPQRRDDDGPPKKKGEGKKGEPGPPGKGDELKKAYDLLRRIKSEGDGRPEDRLRDWTGRATKLYRKAVEASKAGDPRRANELGLAAHDLARAVDHARNASRHDHPDPDLPLPPDGRGPHDRGPVRKDLRRAYDQIRDMGDDDAVEDSPDGTFYLDAARDLYNAARRDAEVDRPERAGELARAAEAMTHVPEHLARAEWRDRGPKGKHGRPEPKEKKDRPEPKERRERPDDDALPPALPPR